MALPAGDEERQRLAAAFGPQVDLGGEPAAAAPERFSRLPGTGGVLVGADDRRVEEVRPPVKLSGEICGPLQGA